MLSKLTDLDNFFMRRVVPVIIAILITWILSLYIQPTSEDAEIRYSQNKNNDAASTLWEMRDADS